MTSKDFFISHSSADKTLVRILKKVLEGSGKSVWLDEVDLSYGEKIWDTIIRGIDSAQAFIFVASENSISSLNVAEELYLARRKQDELVAGYPIYVIKTKADLILPIWMQGLNYLSLQPLELAHKLERFFSQIAGSNYDKLAFAELIAFLEASPGPSFEDGWTAAKNIHSRQVQNVKSLLVAANNEQKSDTLEQILKLSLFEQIAPAAEPIWLNIAPGIFELLLSTPMRIPPKVTFTGVPKNLKYTQISSSNISVRFEFTELISGLPTNDVPISKLDLTLDAEL